tara:strand:+ start:1905 stop:2201 length:297 start_codon:yes stop_codon:yes gene_type:complete
MDELFKISILVKLMCKCTDYDIRGIEGSAYKIWACYLAKKLTAYSDKQIGSFYKIDSNYMNNQVEHLSIALLLDPDCKMIITCIENAFTELQEINKAA